MRRKFIRINSTCGNIPEEKRIISVIGIGRGVGTTTVAAALAFCFAEKGENVTFLECSEGVKVNSLLYNQVAMDQRFANRTFYDFYQLIRDEKPVKQYRNYEEGVNWKLITPDNVLNQVSLTAQEKGRLLYNSGGGTVILDVTDETGWENFLIDSDDIIVVVDPLPSKLIKNVETYSKVRKLEANGMHVIWTINKNNKGVNKHQIKSYIKSNSILWVDYIQAEEIYSDEFACRFHWRNMEFRREMMDIFTRISQ